MSLDPREWVERVRIALFERQHAYKSLFKGPHAEIVLKDLARFCRAHEPCFDPDPRIHAAMEGRREVWLRLEHHLRLDQPRLWELYSGRPREG